MSRSGSGILQKAGGNTLGHHVRGVKDKQSRCGILPVAGYFYFQIDNWSEQILDQWPRNPVFRSDVHTLYGISWQLLVYPRGSLNETPPCVEVQLVNKTNKEIHAKYTISVLDHEQQCYVNAWSDPDGTVIFRPSGDYDDYWGNSDYMPLEEMESRPYLKNNSVKFKVEIVANIEDELGALTPTTNPMGDVKPGTSLEIATSDLKQLSTHMSEQKVRMIKEEEELQDSLVRNRINMMSTFSGTNPQTFTL